MNYLRYRFISAVPRNYHCLEIYTEAKYTPENGLVGEPELLIRSSVGKEIWTDYKESTYFSKSQYENLRTAISERYDVILNPNGQIVK